jgi:hypothetical protein
MNNQIIIIIGLPGSGKTTFSRKFKDFIIFDDFIQKFYDGKVINQLKLNKKICLIDPRLCIFDIFLKYINIIEKYVNRSQIHLILFQNVPESCLNNIKLSNNMKLGNNYLLSIEETIKNYSLKYSLENYNLWQSTIMIVWKSKDN